MVDGDYVFLQPEASYDMAMELGQRGHTIRIGPQTLWKRMKDKGLLVTTEDTRETNTVRRMVKNKRETVLHLRASTVVDAVPPQAAPLPPPPPGDVCPVAGFDELVGGL